MLEKFASLLVLCFMGLAPLSMAIAQTAASATPLTPIDIPVLLPLTGNAAFYGATVQRTMQAVETATNADGGIRNHPVKFVFYDDQANPSTTVQLFGTIPKDTPIVFDAGPVATCRASAAAIKDGPVLYCLSALYEPARGSYFFSSSVGFYDAYDAEFRYFVSRGWTRIALLDNTDASGQVTEDIFNRLLHQPRYQNVSLVASEHFAISDISAAAQISKIESAKPQVIVVSAIGNAAGTALRGLHDAGNELPVASNIANMTVQQMEAYKSFMPPAPSLLTAVPRWAVPEQVRPGPVRDAVKRFLRVLGAAGIRPDGATGIAYDPAVIVIDALRKLGPGVTAPQLRDYLANLQWPGSSGFYDFRDSPQRGLTIKDTTMVCWDQAKGTWVAAPVR